MAPCSRSSRAAFTSSGTWLFISAAGVPGRALYLKVKALANPNPIHQRQGLLEILVGLAGKAHNNVGRDRDVGPRLAHARHQRFISGARYVLYSSRRGSGRRPTWKGRCR